MHCSLSMLGAKRKSERLKGQAHKQAFYEIERILYFLQDCD